MRQLTTKDPLKDKAFKALLDKIIAEGDLLRYTNKHGLCQSIAEFITRFTNKKCATATIEDWFNGRSRPWRVPLKTLALYQYFKQYSHINSSYLVELLLLCEYPNLESFLHKNVSAPPVVNRFPERLYYIPRKNFLETFHLALCTPEKRGVGIFQIGGPPQYGSSITLSQIIQRYKGVDNYLLRQPFTNIVYIDCEHKIPDFSTVAFEIYRQLAREPMPKRKVWRHVLYTLLQDHGKVLLLALDNVQYIPKNSETYRFIKDLGAHHVVLLVSSELIWEQPVLLPVEGFTLDEVVLYAQEKYPMAVRKGTTALNRLREITGGIPDLVFWGLKSLSEAERFNQKSDMQFLSTEVHQRIRNIYTPAWKRLRDHPQWGAIQQVLSVLPLTGDPIHSVILQRNSGLSAGDFASAVHALLHHFLMIEREDQFYDISYPFRWFAIPRTSISESA